jgi:predicted HAD superfamily Cof-like phosphohydrolase
LPFYRSLEAAVIDEIRYAQIIVNLPELVDSWADMNYIHQGSALEFGVDMKPIQRAVQVSNMAKEPGNLRDDGKITKPPGWTAPPIAALLRQQRWQGRP